MSSKFIRTAVAVAATVAVAGSQAATINLIDLGGVTGSQAELGFQLAARYWGNMFTNTATINLGVNFSALPPNVIGSTGSTSNDLSVATWENRVNATKSSSAIDTGIVLPTLSGGGITALTTGVDGTGNNNVNVTATLNSSQTASRVLWENTALIKALGLTATYRSNNPLQLDGRVSFSSTFAFDFDATDGITAGTFDFLGVAIHEIGHALGFVSGVDTFDYFSSPNGPAAGALGYDINDTSIFSALDMFRYSAPGQIDLRVGGTPYFSVDGGVTNLGNFATGSFNGDGDQASHWRDTPGCVAGNGIMDPTFCFGQMGRVKALDLAAFDAMGYNLAVDSLSYAGETSADIYRRLQQVPEPATWVLLIAALGMMSATRRNKRA